jgi:hypothetical protein
MYTNLDRIADLVPVLLAIITVVAVLYANWCHREVARANRRVSEVLRNAAKQGYRP